MDNDHHYYYPYQSLVFWLFIIAVVVVSALRKFLTERERQRTLRAALERGQQIEPALLNNIVTKQVQSDYRHQLQTGGIITLSVGIGLCAMGVFLKPMNSSGFNPTLGPGILVGIIGIGILVAAWLLPRSGNGSGPPDARM